MKTVTELPPTQLDAGTRALLAPHMPAGDTLLYVCQYDDSADISYLYFITDQRAGRLLLEPTGRLNSALRKLDGVVRHSADVVRLQDVVTVREVEVSALLGKGDRFFSLWGPDAQRALLGFRFPAKDGVYERFAAVLRQAVEAARHPRQEPAPVFSPATSEQRLRELAQLRDQGLLTEAEYASKRQAILHSL